MTTLINASPTNGLVQTADGSGVLKVQSNGVTTNALAWVNFNGTGTVAIRSSYNVSSVTDNGTGDYTVNFTTALSDANYSSVMTCSTRTDYTYAPLICCSYDNVTARTTSAIRMMTRYGASDAAFDTPYVCVTIFGN